MDMLLVPDREKTRKQGRICLEHVSKSLNLYLHSLRSHPAADGHHLQLV